MDICYMGDSQILTAAAMKLPREPRADLRSADGSRREHSPALRAETSLTDQSLIGAT